MAIRKYKPTTPGRRGASGADFVEITRDEPEKSLVRPLNSRGGRNVHGRITAPHPGGGLPSGPDFVETPRDEPEKSLVRPLNSRGGRNVHGRITARHQGGGHKRAYRLIDFRRGDKGGGAAQGAHH